MHGPAVGRQEAGAGHKGPGTTGTRVWSCHLGATASSASFPRQGLDPWDSEPPGGMFPQGPAQIPRSNTSLDWFPKAVDEIKTHEAAETDLGGSIQRVNPNLQMQRCHAAKCSYQE